jgi:uncharacterized protein
MKQIILSIFFSALLLGNCSSTQNRIRTVNIADLAYSGDLYTISTEIAKGAAIEERDSFQKKYTALMVASREGDYRLVEWLIENGAIVNAKTRDGHTALMYAAYNRYPEIVRLLIQKGADVHIQSLQGHTALSEVLEIDKQIIIDYLLLAGAKMEKLK